MGWKRTLYDMKNAALEGIANVNSADKFGWSLICCSNDYILIRWGNGPTDFKIDYYGTSHDRWFQCRMDGFINELPTVTVGDEDWCDAHSREEGVRMIITLVARIARAKERR